MDYSKYFYNLLTIKETEFYDISTKGMVELLIEALTNGGFNVVDFKVDVVKIRANWLGEVPGYPDIYGNVEFDIGYQIGMIEIKIPLRFIWESKPYDNRFFYQVFLDDKKIVEKSFNFSPEIDFPSGSFDAIKKAIQQSLQQLIMQIN